MLRLTLILGLLAAPLQAQVQNWPNDKIAEMLVTQLSPTGAMEGGQWFVSASELIQGTRALGIIYAHVPGSAGTVSIHSAVFGWTGTGWTQIVKVDELYGMSPTDAQFFEDRVELTTTTLGPDDARCCPTATVRWSIDLRGGDARILN